MSKFAQLKFIGIVGAVVSALTACAPASVKDIASDKPGYISKNFAPSLLAADVSKRVTARSVQLPFTSMTFKTKTVSELNDGTKKTGQSTQTTYTNVGNGLLQVFKQYASNDIPTNDTYELSYLGLLQLRSQRVFNASQTGNFIMEVKHFDTFANLAPLQPGTKYDFSWSSGRSVQIANYSDMSMTCLAGAAHPASTLFAKLPGNAIDVHCDISEKGSVFLKQDVQYLEQYGVFILMGGTNAGVKVTSEIVEFQVM